MYFIRYDFVILDAASSPARLCELIWFVSNVSVSVGVCHLIAVCHSVGLMQSLVPGERSVVRERGRRHTENRRERKEERKREGGGEPGGDAE